jgi:hypothetical protein
MFMDHNNDPFSSGAKRMLTLASYVQNIIRSPRRESGQEKELKVFKLDIK